LKKRGTEARAPAEHKLLVYVEGRLAKFSSEETTQHTK